MVWFGCREETCRRVGSVERGGTGGLKAQDKAQSTHRRRGTCLQGQGARQRRKRHGNEERREEE